MSARSIPGGFRRGDSSLTSLRLGKRIANGLRFVSQHFKRRACRLASSGRPNASCWPNPNREVQATPEAHSLPTSHGRLLRCQSGRPWPGGASLIEELLSRVRGRQRRHQCLLQYVRYTVRIMNRGGGESLAARTSHYFPATPASRRRDLAHAAARLPPESAWSGPRFGRGLRKCGRQLGNHVAPTPMARSTIASPSARPCGTDGDRCGE